MGEISAKIDSIIASRKAKVSVLQKEKGNIQAIHDNVNRFRELQKNISNSPEKYSMFQGNSDVIGNISNISTEKFYNALSKYNHELDRMIERIGRNSLNICFVGCAGHGKSLVMQKISGLKGNVIPSADGSDCTGAKSVITNVNSNSVSASITFFNQAEMIEVINKYLSKITLEASSHIKISSVSEIPELSSKMAFLRECVSTNSSAIEALRHLEKYIDHYNDYSSLLGYTKEIPESEIEQYVAQYKSTDPSIKYYRYLSVKNANIKCRFNHEDVGKIVLVDTIGIGATSIGVENDMLDAIENDSDAIIYMLRPEPLRPRLDQHTIDAWEKIKERISADYMNQMLFVVLNKVMTGKGENKNNIEEIARILSNPSYNKAALLEVDCISDTDVRKKLLDPVLTHLTSHIEDVDKLLIKKLNALGEELRQTYNEICLQTEKAFVKSANGDMKRHFNTRIDSTYNKMLSELRELYVHKYNDLRTQPCTELEKECQQKLKNILISVPKVEEIRDLLDMGTMTPIDVYKTGTNILRMKIINDFTNLNTVLSEIIEGMKLEILDVFFNNGLLNRIASFDKGDSSTDWINSFLAKTDSDSKYPLICEALKSFDNYTINVQGFIIHEVRDRLDTIDMMINKNSPQFMFGIDQKDKLAAEIVEELKGKAFDIKSKLTGSLAELYKIPNKSMFAAITDLCDRLSFSKKGNDSVTLEWRYLYEDWMRQIWTEEYDKQSGLRQVIGEWNNVISSLKEMNKPECFIIR